MIRLCRFQAGVVVLRVEAEPDLLNPDAANGRYADEAPVREVCHEADFDVEGVRHGLQRQVVTPRVRSRHAAQVSVEALANGEAGVPLFVGPELRERPPPHREVQVLVAVELVGDRPELARAVSQDRASPQPVLGDLRVQPALSGHDLTPGQLPRGEWPRTWTAERASGGTRVAAHELGADLPALNFGRHRIANPLLPLVALW